MMPAILLTVNISFKTKNETTAVMTGMRLEKMEARLTPSLRMTNVWNGNAKVLAKMSNSRKDVANSEVMGVDTN